MFCMKSKDVQKIKNEKDKENTNYLVPEGTTHLMIWLGGALPEKRKVAYDNYRPIKEYRYLRGNSSESNYRIVNYVNTLQGECGIMAEKNEACILVYDSKMVNEEEKKQLEKTVNDIPNCYLVDYEDFIKQTDDIEFDKNQIFCDNRIKSHYNHLSDFIKNIDQLVEHNKEEIDTGYGNLTIPSLGNLVDCIRLLLLLQPQKVKQLAIDKNKYNKTVKPNMNDFTLLYHDFDVIQDTNVKKKTNLSKKVQENCLIFCKPMGNSSNSTYENGIIFANSEKNRNQFIENIIHKYINENFLNVNKYLSKNGKNLAANPIYDLVIEIGNIKMNDFRNQYIDEGHRSWIIKNDISKNDISEIEYKKIKEINEDNKRSDKRKIKNNEINNKKSSDKKNNTISCTCSIF